MEFLPIDDCYNKVHMQYNQFEMKENHNRGPRLKVPSLDLNNLTNVHLIIKYCQTSIQKKLYQIQ